MSAALIRPAQELRRDLLWELLGTIRRESVRRGEILPGSWVDETTDEILRSERDAWTVADGAEIEGIVLTWTRSNRAYGLFHSVLPGKGPGPIEQLAHAVVDRLPRTIHRFDASATGLDPADEIRLGERLQRSLGFEMIVRHAMVRPLILDQPPPEPTFPSGLRLVPTRTIPVEELAALDWQAYLGTPDEALLADGPEGNREMLESAFADQFGRFLSDASPAVRDPEEKLVGFVVTCEKTIRDAVFFDVVVDPRYRRQGIGRSLLMRGLRALVALGYREAHLWVTQANAPARALYERVGFGDELTAALYRWYRNPVTRLGAAP
jgi:ribosomal protein S18 acetylase RimI-like enzyme